MTMKSGMLGKEVFFQGKYLSIGVNEHGGLGTRYSAPTGVATDFDIGFSQVGMFADLDGFGMGAKTTLHDAVLPGRAIEGFNIGYKMGAETFVQSNLSLSGFKEIAGTATNSSTAGQGQAGWTGVTSEKLKVDQKITLTEDAKFVRVDVTLTNTSTSAMSDLRYMRTADADQGSTFATDNRIVKQAGSEALVASYTSGGTSPFFLYANDPRAVASTYGWVNSDPYAAAAFSVQQAEGYARKADQSVNLTFGLGTLNAGQSTTLTMYMGVTDNLAATIASIGSPAPTIPTTPGLPDDAILQRAGSQDGSAATNDVLTGPAHHNSFYFDSTGKTGADKITNFGNDDVLVLKKALYDGNGDGLVGLSLNKLSLDGVGGTDSVVMSGVTSLRFLGQSDSGLFVYADSGARPRGVIEGGLGDDVSSGDAADAARNKFFFDTALDIDLGADQVGNFGAKDILITTSALLDSNGDGIILLGSDGQLDLVGGVGGPGDTVYPGEAGSVALKGVGGAAVQALELDGSVLRDGTTYFVYSLIDSSAGMADLTF